MATEYGEKLAKDYAKGWTHDTPRRSMIYYTWLQACGDVDGLRIADLACGSGESSRMLATKGAGVVGLDLSSHQLEFARKIEEQEQAGITYHQADLRDISTIPDVGKFDMVTPTFLFNYAENVSQLYKMAQSAADLLQPGGRMCGITVNPFNPTEHRIDEEGADVTWEDENQKFVDGTLNRVQLYNENGDPIEPFSGHHYNPETYESAFKDAGFTNVEWVKLQMPSRWKEKFPKWKELQDGTSVIVFTAVKSS